MYELYEKWKMSQDFKENVKAAASDLLWSLW